MKIRAGFVSNSSSSSYIISYPVRDKCDKCNREDFDIEQALENDQSRFYDETQVLASGLKAIIDKLRDRYDEEILYYTDGDDPSYIRDEFINFMGMASKVARKHKDNNKMLWVRIAYSDYNMYDALCKAVGVDTIMGWDF